MRDYLLSSDLMRRPMHAHAIDVCERHKVSLTELKCARRFKVYVRARDEFAFLAHTDGYSYPQIAKFLGDRDHTTVLDAARRHMKREGLIDGQ